VESEGRRPLANLAVRDRVIVHPAGLAYHQLLFEEFALRQRGGSPAVSDAIGGHYLLNRLLAQALNADGAKVGVYHRRIAAF
jgi:hypothetical protein